MTVKKKKAPARKQTTRVEAAPVAPAGAPDPRAALGGIVAGLAAFALGTAEQQIGAAMKTGNAALVAEIRKRVGR